MIITQFSKYRFTVSIKAVVNTCRPLMNFMVLIARNARNALNNLIILSTTLAEPAESDELADALLRSWIHS